MYRRYHGIIPSCDPQHSYTITLERDDASTSHPMRELTFYGEGFSLEREPQETIMTPILPTRLVLYLQSESNFQFEHIARDTHEWTARLQLDDKTIFLGRIETGLYEEDFAEPPYEVRLTATCGLQSLYDRDLIAEEIPINQAGVISVRDFINHLLKGAYPRGYQRNSLFRQSVANYPIYIDPLAYDSSDKPLKQGEVLETLLHDLCLNVRSSGGLFVVAPALYFPANGTPYKLGSQETPIYATPQLQSDRGIGQLHLTLPSEETPTLAPYRTPKDPVVIGTISSFYGVRGTVYPPFIHQIAVTEETTAKAPTEEERLRGITLKLSNIDQNTDRQGVLLGTFIGDSFWGAPIEVTVPMRFTLGKVTYLDGDMQLCLDAYLCYYDTDTRQYKVCYQATIGTVYQKLDIYDPSALFQAESREQIADRYHVKGMGMVPRGSSTAGWTDCRMAHNVVKDDITTYDYDHYSDELKAHRNYSKVPAKDLFVPSEFADFHFTFLPPLTHIMEYHNDRRAQRGEKRKPTPNYLLLRISSDFWHIVDSDVTRFYPDHIDLGKVTVKYQLKEDKEHPYTEWLTADRATTYLRRLEEQLTYATSEASLVQPIGLRYKLLNEQGDWLPTLQGGRTLVEYFSEQYMRAYARPYDTLTATVRSQARPHGIDLQQYSVKGRPGRTYYAMGSLYHPGEGSSEELTLIEVPTSQTEETRFTS